MAKRAKKPKGKKRVSYELINPDHIVGGPVYNVMNELIEAHHSDLKDARIAMAWCTSWRPDRDGHCILGKCVKSSDLNREMAPFDFVILLFKPWWYDEKTTKEQRAALVDHELCHAAVQFDDRTGEPVYDERGRKTYRIRKHDIEEFSQVVDRHGCWTRDIEFFYAAIIKSARERFNSCGECSTEGWRTNTDGRAERCPCWLKWSTRHEVAKQAPQPQAVSA